LDKLQEILVAFLCQIHAGAVLHVKNKIVFDDPAGVASGADGANVGPGESPWLRRKSRLVGHGLRSQEPETSCAGKRHRQGDHRQNN
jgi:hypothetical protein